MKYPWLCVIALSLLAAGCNGGRQSDASDSARVPLEISDITSEAEHWADSVTATLTLRQKIAQMFMPALFASDDYWTLRQIREYADSCIGGVVLLKGDTNGAAILSDTLRTAGKVIPFVAIDAEWGLAMRLADAPEFPSNREISPRADDQMMYDYGRELARECRILGINMVLGPVVDVSVPSGFMRNRSLGDNPLRVADLAIAYARGLEDGNVVSVAKHFPGHGSVTSDSHKMKGVIERSLNEMDSIDLYPFRKWIEQRLTGIMVGHLAVPSIDSDMLPAAMSRTVITDLLRTDLGFDGLVLTDAINMKGAQGLGADTAIRAGADMIIAPSNTFSEIAKVEQAVKSGAITEEEINTHVRKILFYKYLFCNTDPESERNTDKSTHGIRPDIADSISARLRR